MHKKCNFHIDHGSLSDMGEKRQKRFIFEIWEKCIEITQIFYELLRQLRKSHI